MHSELRGNGPEAQTLPQRHNRGARVLLLAPVMPSDRGNGLAMRAGFFLDAYARIANVDLIVVPVAGSLQFSAFALSRARSIKVLELAGPDSHYRLVASVIDPRARLNALRSYGRPSLAAFGTPALCCLRSLVVNSRYDLVHIFRLYLADLGTPWLGMNSSAPKLVMDCDENDAATYRRIATSERRAGHVIAAETAEAEASAFARFAEHWLPKFDVVLAASHQEARSLTTFGARTRTIANVVPTPRPSPAPAPQLPTILFIGTLGYPPNMDGILWFCTRVFGRLQRVLAYRLRLVIVGRHPSALHARLGFQRGIEVWDDVDDIGRCYRNANLVIAPLRAGGGTRIKIIEAAKHGVPIVATRLAAEGTSFQNGVDMLVADSAEGFLRACLLLIRNRSLARRLAWRARAKANRDYSQNYWRLQVAHLINEGDSTLEGNSILAKPYG
jgi:glycosyltransferase involved in cell wall biosynthesis